jgi:hypothetical protein
MIKLIDRRQSQERRRWLNERRGHVPVIDRRNYPPITENSDPVIRNFGGAGEYHWNATQLAGKARQAQFRNFENLDGLKYFSDHQSSLARSAATIGAQRSDMRFRRANTVRTRSL